METGTVNASLPAFFGAQGDVGAPDDLKDSFRTLCSVGRDLGSLLLMHALDRTQPLQDNVLLWRCGEEVEETLARLRASRLDEHGRPDHGHLLVACQLLQGTLRALEGHGLRRPSGSDPFPLLAAALHHLDHVKRPGCEAVAYGRSCCGEHLAAFRSLAGDR